MARKKLSKKLSKVSKEERERFIEAAEKVLKDPNAKWVTPEEFLEEVKKSEEK